LLKIEGVAGSYEKKCRKIKGTDRAGRSLSLIVYIVLIICLLIGQEPTVNFGNKHNLTTYRLHMQCMISRSNVKLCFVRRFDKTQDPEGGDL